MAAPPVPAGGKREGSNDVSSRDTVSAGARDVNACRTNVETHEKICVVPVAEMEDDQQRWKKQM
jgi:hypothetical protein